MNKQQTLETIIPIAQQAGELLRDYFSKPIEQTTKSTDIDIVTTADKASEAYITTELTRCFPDHHLVGEEGGGMGKERAEAAYLWYIDPIDGTSNFANGIPHFAITLTMVDHENNPLVGLVYDPMRAEMFTATAGGDAFLNGKALHVSAKTTLVQSIVASGFPYDKQTSPDNNTRQWAEFVTRVRGIRRLGSAALDLAYVAAGRFDAYWERSLKPWDAVAAMLIVREAGGTVTDYVGGNRPQDNPEGRYIASNGHLHAEMMAILAETYRA